MKQDALHASLSEAPSRGGQGRGEGAVVPCMGPIRRDPLLVPTEPHRPMQAVGGGGSSTHGSGKPRAGGVAMHQNSSQLQDCLNPVRGVRDQQRRDGLVPVNHARNNASAVAQRSALNRELRAREEERAAAEAEARRSPAPALLGNAKSSSYASPAYVPRRASPTEAPGPARPSPGDQGSGGPPRRPFVGAAPLSQTCSERVASQERDSGRFLRKKEYGQVPRYLLNIQLQLAEQHAQRQAEREAALIPPGMRVLPEEERLDMLEVLAQSRDEAEAELRALPFRLETNSQLRHKAGLEQRIEEIDSAITVFSRPRVLVQLEGEEGDPEGAPLGVPEGHRPHAAAAAAPAAAMAAAPAAVAQHA